jgi:ABC-2 type transport system permease protein
MCYARPHIWHRRDGGEGINRQVRRAWELLYLLTFRELKLRYQDTVFGFLWSLIRPLLQGAVLFVVLASSSGSTSRTTD